MSEFMVKVRGEAKGPYSAAQLQTQIRRKRLSRQHQVSPDGGASWMRAGELEELFPTQVPAPTAPVLEPQSEVAQVNTVVAPEASVEEAKWSYMALGEQLGPIPESQVRMLVASGGIDATTLLWREGMTDWVEVQHIPTFAAAVRSKHGDLRSALGPSHSEPASISSEKVLHWPSLAALLIALVSLSLTIPASLFVLIVSGAMESTRLSRSMPASGLLMLALVMLPGLLFAITSVTVGHAAHRLSNKTPGRFEGNVYAIIGLALGYTILFATACVGIISLVSVAK